VKSLYLSNPSPSFNPFLTSCFSKRFHIVACHGVAIEGKNNWHHCCVRLLPYGSVTLRRMALGGPADTPGLCLVSVIVTCVLVTESQNRCLDFRVVTESLDVYLDSCGVTSLNPCVSSCAFTEPLSILLLLLLFIELGFHPVAVVPC
jgi:hypothetical protein